MESSSSSDPKFHTKQVESKLSELIDHLRADIKKMNEPKAQALFETAAEVLSGLRKAFADYQAGTEQGMRTAKKK